MTHSNKSPTIDVGTASVVKLHRLRRAIRRASLHLSQAGISLEDVLALVQKRRAMRRSASLPQ